MPTPPPSASVSAPAPTKPIDAEAVRTALAALSPKIRGCYEAALLRDQKALGTMTLALTVNAKGTADSASLDGAITDPAFSSCVADLVKAATFPTSDGATNVTYPLRFMPSRAPHVSKGGLDAASVEKTVRTAYDKLRACHEAGLKKDAAFGGRLRVVHL